MTKIRLLKLNLFNIETLLLPAYSVDLFSEDCLAYDTKLHLVMKFQF